MIYNVQLDNISWDTEVDGVIEEVEDLPTSYFVDDIEADEEEEAVEYALDYVSDIFGYCIFESSATVTIEGE